MSKFRLLVWVVGFDVAITLFGVGYLGFHEPNPLCYNFIHFMIIKLIVTVVCLFGFYKLRGQKFVGGFVVILIVFYSLIGIGNLWQTVNYLYY